MTNKQIHRDRARKCAEADFDGGLKCCPKYWGCRTGSAWEYWYLERYNQLKGAGK